MSFELLLTLVLVYQTEVAYSYSTGAPNSGTSCTTLIPGHPPSTATGVAPYNLSLSANAYKPGDVIQGTLYGLGKAQFKGFLIAARRSSGQTDNIGNFGAQSDSHTICSQSLGNGLTQSTNSPKTSVSFNWTAPSTSVGDVVFHYTVVRGGAPNTTRNTADYFLNLTSTTIKAATVNSFSKNPECGKTRGCISNCVSNVCDWEFSWKNAASKYEITIKSILTNNGYVSLGFSNTSAMGPATVVSCVLTNDQVSVNVSYNKGHNNQVLTNSKEGISNETNSYISNVLECSFSQDTISDNPQIFNLTDPWYLIAARGPIKADGTLGYHGHSDRYQTNVRINLSNVTTDYTFPGIATTTSGSTRTTALTGSTRTTALPGSTGITAGSTSTASPSNAFPKDPACGLTKGCYTICNGDLCDLLLAWENKGDEFEITLKSVFPDTGDHYVSFGLSNASAMAPASVLSCTVYQSTVGIVESTNPGYYNVPLANQTEGLSGFTGSYVDGVLSCTVLRETSPSNSQIYDLSKLWYLIAARGTADAGGNLEPHDASQGFRTTSRINFTDTNDHSAEELTYPLVKVHGCLMAVTWILAASIGLVMARFFKKMWPDNKLCGLKVWFAVHRAAMVTTFVIGMAAFAVIFIEIKAYSDIHGEMYKQAHPILGIIVTGLLFINPFMSLLRCGPDHPRRPLFNWAHWLVGTSSHILGGVTITLGLYLPKASLDANKGLIIMIVYGSWYVVYFLIMTLLDCLSTAKPSKTVATSVEPVELTDVHPVTLGVKSSSLNDSQSQNDLGGISNGSYAPLTGSNEPPYSGVKKLLTLAHFVILLGLTVSLMYLIVYGDI